MVIPNGSAHPSKSSTPKNHSMQPAFSRRTFLRTSALASAGLATNGCGRLFGKDEVRFAVVGIRGRGKQLIKHFIKLAYPEPADPDLPVEPVPEIPPARLVAICDVDSAELDKCAKMIQDATGATVETYSDYRKLLEQKHIDAVVIATPNHQHALQTIWACEAGKDVYVEKPVCHSVWEGRQMVAAAAYHNRIVQAGFQNRSDIGLVDAFPLILAGELGPIKHVRGLCYRNRHSIGPPVPPTTPPPTVDYDQWLGPADDLPINRQQFHYDWHWVWNTGNGDLGNQGPHELDLIRWILGDPGHPQEVFTVGGRFGWNDAGETPNMQISSYVWNNIPVHFEVRNMTVDPNTNAAPSFLGTRVGVIITCEGGQFRGGRGAGFFYDNEGKRMRAFRGDGGGDHLPSFFRSVLTRRRSQLRSSIEQGYHSSSLSHLANISYQIGDVVGDDAVQAGISEDEWLVEARIRFVDQMKSWNLNPSQLQWTLGPRLAFDGGREQFTGEHATQANPLLKREGRGSYRIPEYS
jgi:predicted dehydrogenase